ncbi:MAG: HDOD domain-containing protein [Pseudomonadota bacterium]
MLHDIGKIIMNNMDSQQFQAAMQKCYNDQVSFSEAERQVYSYTHSEVGALVIKKWNFPDILMHAVLKHHTFDFAEDEDAYQVRLACVVGLANMFCHKAGVGMREPDDNLELFETVPAQLLGIDQQKMEILLESFNAAYEKDKSYFG